MRVDSVRAFPVRVKLDEKLSAGSFAYEDYMSVLVKVECDGVVGWGEAMTRFSPSSTAGIVDWIGGKLTGREYTGPREAWSSVWQLFRVRGQTRGVAVEALSGVEIALWDALGKQRGKPVGRLLGRQRNKRVPAYAGSVFESRGPIEAQVERAKSLGLRGLKLKIGFGVERDAGLVRDVRRNWEEGMLVVDANGAYDVRQANSLVERIADFEPEWFEEPIPADEFVAYDLVSRKVPVAAGEAWFSGDFEIVFARKSVDILEPSVSRCGGIGTDFAVAARAETAGMGFSPMRGLNSALSVAASLQVASAVNCMAIEHDAFGNPLVEDLVPGFPSIKEGKMEVPSKPGLGVEVDEAFVSSHSAS